MKRTILAAAFLSASVFGATVTQKADLNFNFRTPVGDHQSGAYKLQIRDNGAASTLIEVHNVETGKRQLFYPVSTIQPKQLGEKPRLVFKCTGSECNLAQIWTSHRGFEIRQRKPTPAQAERMTANVPATTITVAVAE